MTLFGTTLDGSALASIAMLLLVLVGFAMNYRSERGYGQWFKQWEADRKARRDAELARERGEDSPPANGSKRGPWG
ncbi:hypothetical protein BH10PSE1_BH10PSE1_18680 [soil metagenome]